MFPKIKTIFLPLYIIFCSAIPLGCFFFNSIICPPAGTEFCIFISMHTILRIWETFFTSQEKQRLILDKDWTLTLVLIAYIVFFILIISEFFITKKTINAYVALIGIVGYLLAFGIRLLCMRVLGKQWAIHAVGDTRVNRRRLIKIGPYGLVRHPIYISTLLELLAVIFIVNAYYSFMYYVFFVVPAYFLRMKSEELNNEKIFGNEYQVYKKKVGMFFPRLKFLKEKL